MTFEISLSPTLGFHENTSLFSCIIFHIGGGDDENSNSVNKKYLLGSQYVPGMPVPDDHMQ